MFVITIIAVLFGMAIVLGWNDSRRLLGLAVFFAPWSGLDADVGLRVTAYLIVTVALLLLAMARAMRVRIRHLYLPLGLWLVIGYAVVWSLVQIHFLPQVYVEGGFLRSPELRVVAQIGMFLITLSPIFVVPFTVRSYEDLKRLARIYVISISVLAAIGWLQLAMWMLTGENPIPMGYIDSLLTDSQLLRSGMFSFEETMVYRMNSFGGEPKVLGVSLAVGLLLLQAGARPAVSKTYVLWFFLVASLIATFSTMGILVWGGATIVQILITPSPGLRLPGLSRSLKKTTVAFLFLAGPLLAGGFYFSGQADRLSGLLISRTMERISESEHGVMEDFNVAVYDFLRDQPGYIFTGVGLGNAHLYANAYLPQSAWHYADGTVFVAKSAALRWISEIGLVTLVLFLLGVYWNVKRAVRVSLRSEAMREISGIYAKFSLPLMAIWLISGYVSPQFFLMIGVIGGAIGLAKSSSQRHRSGVGQMGLPSEH